MTSWFFNPAGGHRWIYSACWRWSREMQTRWICGWQIPSCCPSLWWMPAFHTTSRVYWRYSPLQPVMLGILATTIFSTTRRFDILPSAAAAGRDVVSDAPCVLGDELQQCIGSSSGVLVPSVPAAAQHDPTCQSAVCIEPVHQPGHSPAHSFLLLLHPVHGEQPAIVQFKGLEINGSP